MQKPGATETSSEGLVSWGLVMLATTRLIGLALLLVVPLSGCGRSSKPESSPAGGTETVTFHVTDMGKRLALM